MLAKYAALKYSSGLFAATVGKMTSKKLEAKNPKQSSPRSVFSATKCAVCWLKTPVA